MTRFQPLQKLHNVVAYALTEILKCSVYNCIIFIAMRGNYCKYRHIVYVKYVIFFLSSFLYLSIPQSRTYTPGTYNPNARGTDACRRSNCLWIGTLDTQGRASLNVWSGPPPETEQGITQTKDKHSIKIPTDQATATDYVIFK